MAITKKQIEDKIEIVGEYKNVQVRTATVIEEDGVELTRSFHRHVITPDSDISGESAQVQAICAAVHTPEIKAAYQQHLDSQHTQEIEDSYQQHLDSQGETENA